MSYTVKRTNGTTLTTVADQTINTSDTSLNLVGRGAINYGQAFAENFVHLLESFANTAAPANPLTGQIWYDTTSAATKMKYFNGAVWKEFSGGGTGGTTDTPGGTTIGGLVGTPPRTGGCTGVILEYGSQRTTVAVLLSEGKIIAIACSENIANAFLPATVQIEGYPFDVKSRFPLGISAGFTMAVDAGQAYVMAGVATASLYADLAERYEASEPLEAGDVVEIGGAKEIQKSSARLSENVFGIISTAPGVKLNDAAGTDATHPFVALAGRVPCKVVGKVAKGQRLVTSATPGVAEGAIGHQASRYILGRALADKLDDDVGVVEVVLGGVK